ncbi:SAM-dependent methyltransferase [Nonomuraea sp. NPDC051191]|uniref:SAM-dependent methyltransferase n=1 Tax=Nonomuraea sp. NPDC051191 TaxID=3364372 RepID=UPI0037963575
MTVDDRAPSSARIYNYLLGGTDNHPVDRQAAEAFKTRLPTIEAAARANRGFVLRAARAMAEAGVRQFLDIGCGLPIEPSVHGVVREVHPDARVVRVDNDPEIAPARQALADAPTVFGDLRDPAAILNDPVVTGLVDFGEPVGVITVAVWHFVPEDEAVEYAATLRAGLASGSHLAISHVCADTVPEPAQGAGKAVYARTANPVRARTEAEIRAFFDGFTLLDPGLVPLGDWRPYGGDPYPEHATESLAGVGRK